ncbi:MAG TPA: alpha-ketoglutarate-dependent dioxygenase AlkB, partial [Pseudomonas sp.]
MPHRDQHPVTLDLFGDLPDSLPREERLGPQALLLRGFALPFVDELLPALAAVEAAAPFRIMLTPGGQSMSVALTNCGALGWISDRGGYRYSPLDPLSGQPWPALPQAFRRLAHEAAAAAGFPDFAPDACLVNRYLPGTRMSLHQDRDERSFARQDAEFLAAIREGRTPESSFASCLPSMRLLDKIDRAMGLS